jgi:hypothetical protein
MIQLREVSHGRKFARAEKILTDSSHRGAPKLKTETKGLLRKWARVVSSAAKME